MERHWELVGNQRTVVRSTALLVEVCLLFIRNPNYLLKDDLQ